MPSTVRWFLSRHRASAERMPLRNQRDSKTCSAPGTSSSTNQLPPIRIGRIERSTLKGRRREHLSHVERCCVHSGVEPRDFGGIAVEKLSRHELAGVNHTLHRLAPARMRDVGVHIGPEAVFGGLERFPQADGTLFDEGYLPDRLDGLEAIFPGQMQAKRRAVLP